mgnify:CR=1 FL=1
MKRKIIVSITFVIFLIILMTSINDNYFFNRSICREKREKYILKIDAIVTAKFIDSLNHNYNTLILKDNSTGRQTKLYIINESDGFYKNVTTGDILIKESQSLIIRNLSKNRIDTLNYKCKD